MPRTDMQIRLLLTNYVTRFRRATAIRAVQVMHSHLHIYFIVRFRTKKYSVIIFMGLPPA